MDAAIRIPRAKFVGRPLDIGRKHGEEFRDRVHQSIELYRVWFSDTGHLDWNEVLEHATKFVPYIQAGAPDLLEEMRGIAEGAEVPFEAIVALNCRTEIGYGVSGALSTNGEELSECSAIGIPSTAAADGHTYIGQNWDWRHTHLAVTVLMDIQKWGAPALYTLTEAGMVGKIGMNDAGVGLCFNLLATDRNRVGMPAHVLARQVLEQRRLDTALKVVAAATRAGAGNFLIGYHDKNAGVGEVANMEWAATDFNIDFAGDFIARTNHFMGAIFGARDRVKFYPEAGMSTYVRRARAQRILGEFARNGRLGREALETAFRDHFNHPNSICSHPVPRENNLGQSNSSIIMDLADRVFSYTDGPPCDATYHRLRR